MGNNPNLKGGEPKHVIHALREMDTTMMMTSMMVTMMAMIKTTMMAMVVWTRTMMVASRMR